MKNIINITKTACQRLSVISKQNNTNHILLYVKGGGCNGFNYKLEPLNEIPENVEVIKRDNYNLYVCNNSLLYLMGTTIDWKKDIMGSYFDFENPIASSTCGCGTSFNVE